MFLVIGLALIALAVWLHRHAAVPADAVLLPGRVVGHQHKRVTGSPNRTLVGSVVAYDHPESGRMETMEPRTFSRRAPAVGDRVQLAYSRTEGHVRLVDAAQRGRTLLTVGGIGVAMALVQVLIWMR